MSNRVRVLRILEYVGNREWVEDTLKRSSVPVDGVKVVPNKGDCFIKSGLVDKFPEVLNESEHQEYYININLRLVDNEILNPSNIYYLTREGEYRDHTGFYIYGEYCGQICLYNPNTDVYYTLPLKHNDIKVYEI